MVLQFILINSVPPLHSIHTQKGGNEHLLSVYLPSTMQTCSMCFSNILACEVNAITWKEVETQRVKSHVQAPTIVSGRIKTESQVYMTLKLIQIPSF